MFKYYKFSLVKNLINLIGLKYININIIVFTFWFWAAVVVYTIVNLIFLFLLLRITQCVFLYLIFRGCYLFNVFSTTFGYTCHLIFFFNKNKQMEIWEKKYWLVWTNSQTNLFFFPLFKIQAHYFSFTSYNEWKAYSKSVRINKIAFFKTKIGLAFPIALFSVYWSEVVTGLKGLCILKKHAVCYDYYLTRFESLTFFSMIDYNSPTWLKLIFKMALIIILLGTLLFIVVNLAFANKKKQCLFFLIIFLFFLLFNKIFFLLQIMIDSDTFNKIVSLDVPTTTK